MIHARVSRLLGLPLAACLALGCGDEHDAEPGPSGNLEVFYASKRNQFPDIHIDLIEELKATPSDRIASVDPQPGFQIQLVFDASELMDEQTRQVVRAAADRWEHAITADVPDIEVTGRLSCNGHVAPTYIDDLVVVVGTPYIDGPENRLGIGAPCAARQDAPAVPAFGVLELDVSDLGDEQRALAVATHELGHVLGFGALWERAGLLHELPTESGAMAPMFIGLAGIEAFEAAGGHGSGVPVEVEGGAESALGHWNEAMFGPELMSPRLELGLLPLSAVTIASLADLGYEVDVSQADPFSFDGD